MPPHGEYSGNGYGMPRPVRLWLLVVIFFLIQVPAVAVLAWPGPGRLRPV
ncbi:hypothetical protein [Cryobacterium sp. N19]|nr:hypothetical protein [Cryobacterium sp. N19]